MGWIDTYEFPEDFADLRADPDRAHSMAAELHLELGPAHDLAARAWQVIAEALPQEEIVLQLTGEEVALVHLTWRRAAEPAPFPLMKIVKSQLEFEALVHFRY